MLTHVLVSLLTAAGPLGAPAPECVRTPAAVAPAGAATTPLAALSTAPEAVRPSRPSRADHRERTERAERLDRADARLARALRARPSAARRIVRKREIVAPVSTGASVERADPSVPRLAEALTRAASSQRRRDGRPGLSAALHLRMLAAGGASMRLHLPPPTHLL